MLFYETKFWEIFPIHNPGENLWSVDTLMIPCLSMQGQLVLVCFAFNCRYLVNEALEALGELQMTPNYPCFWHHLSQCDGT